MKRITYDEGEALGHDERCALEALAVLGVPSPVTDVSRVLRAVGVTTSRGQKFNNPRVSDALEGLRRRGLCSAPRHAAQLDSGVLLDTARAMHEEGRFATWFEAARRVMPTAEAKAEDLVRRRRTRDLWGALRLGDAPAIEELAPHAHGESLRQMIAAASPEDLESFPAPSLAVLVPLGLDECFERWRDPRAFLDVAATLEPSPALELARAHVHFARGELATAARLVPEQPPSPEAAAVAGTLSLIDGDSSRAGQCFEVARWQWGRCAPGAWPLLTLAALARHRLSGSPAFVEADPLLFPGLRAYAEGHAPSPLDLWRRGVLERYPWLYLMHCALEVYAGSSTAETRRALDGLAERAADATFEQAALEVGVLRRLAAGEEETTARSIFAALAPGPAWQRKLEQLRQLADRRTPKPAEAAPAGRRRLVFAVAAHTYGLDVEPRLQSRRGSGWSKGRKVALQRLLDDPPLPLTAEDRAVVDHLEVETHRGMYGYPETYIFFDEAVHEALARHPHVVRADDPTVPVQVRARRPVLEVEERDGAMELRLSPSQPGAFDEGAHIEVVAFDEAHHALAAIVGEGLEFPARARDEVRATVAGLGRLVDLSAEAELPGRGDRPADESLRVRLRRDGPLSLSWTVVVCPAGPDGPSYAPGTGPRRVAAGGAALRRDLEREREALDALLAACPSMSGPDGQTEGAEASLALLSELGEADATLEWPEGEPLRLRRVPSSAVRLALGGETDWLELGGGVELDEGRVLEMRELLRRLREREGFVELGDGQILVLADDLQRQLGRLAAFATERGRLHESSLAVLPDLTVPVDASPGVEERLGRARRALREPVKVPDTLEAELRGYQRDGFEWLARRARLGLGACLADDMGLGKTVQTLALLLARAAEGPALVVAPTSVVAGWMEQALRFAPSLRLRPIEPGSSSEERARVVSEASAFDLVLTSWDLMRREIARLREVRFATVVLDEAQAMKNARSKRAKAARQLRGDARVALSGTPLENHLDELYSLFAFLQPGLLGSQAAFRREVVGPCEAGDAGTRQRLRALLEPFVLRRTKAEVLRELPPRTDMCLRIRPGRGQASLIEAIRREGLERVERAGEDARVEVLAALTRLRQACCHPRLVVPKSRVASAKTAAFLELVDELRSGGHRALVFSQFVRHLELVRGALDRRGIPYQYLDGSTPARARRERVAAFQGGEGDLFLISLEAGGTGLNLTAADYVVHLDPWWNPASEDQASDRAHRIGQTRPVTVYRLVLEGSVEEKILALHERKRELADAVLSGLDTDRLDLDALRGLLAGG